MSFEAMLWAMTDAPIADVNEFAVLGILGQYADVDGCNAFPSKATIADRAKIDPKSVQRALDRLEARRLIGLGDQSAAAHIRADRRPPVYDLLIPASWLLRPEHAERVRKFRKAKGRLPLTRDDRPDIAPAPSKSKRADAGRTRPEREDSKSPRASGHGGTTSPARGDSQSATGGLQDPRTYVLTPTDDSLSARLPQQTQQSPAASVGERETAPLLQKLMDDHGATEDEAQAVLDRVRREGRIGNLVSWACSPVGSLDFKQRLAELRTKPRAAPAATQPAFCDECDHGLIETADGFAPCPCQRTAA